jgi:hypothetical protein
MYIDNCDLKAFNRSEVKKPGARGKRRLDPGLPVTKTDADIKAAHADTVHVPRQS